MAGNKKPRKKYRPRQRGERLLKTQPLKVKLVLQPLIDLIDEMETTEMVSADEFNQPIFRCSIDGVYYSAVPALNGFIEFYEIVERRHGIDLDLDPMRAFRDNLERGALMTESDTAPVRACIDRLRAATYELTSSEAIEITNITQLAGNWQGQQSEGNP